jgi:ketosteroid isomerase-like protein
VSDYSAEVVAPTVVAELARHWEDGWNAADVDVIMAPFAADVVFSSPFVPRLTGDGRDTVEGREALRSYVVDALERASDVKYTLDAALAGTDTVVLVYRCHLPDGVTKPGADLMRLDGDGRVVEWRCHYATDPTAWRP